MDLSVIRSKNDDEKTTGKRRLAFQVPENSSEACGRSFEDAFILANQTLFDLDGGDDSSLEQSAFEKAKKIGDSSKANFAIEYAIEKPDWNVPKYIKEGLIWLSDYDKVATEKGTGEIV